MNIGFRLPFHPSLHVPRSWTQTSLVHFPLIQAVISKRGHLRCRFLCLLITPALGTSDTQAYRRSSPSGCILYTYRLRHPSLAPFVLSPSFPLIPFGQAVICESSVVESRIKSEHPTHRTVTLPHPVRPRDLDRAKAARTTQLHPPRFSTSSLGMKSHGVSPERKPSRRPITC